MLDKRVLADVNHERGDDGAGKQKGSTPLKGGGKAMYLTVNRG